MPDIIDLFDHNRKKIIIKILNHIKDATSWKPDESIYDHNKKEYSLSNAILKFTSLDCHGYLIVSNNKKGVGGSGVVYNILAFIYCELDANGYVKDFYLVKTSPLVVKEIKLAQNISPYTIARLLKNNIEFSNEVKHLYVTDPIYCNQKNTIYAIQNKMPGENLFIIAYKIFALRKLQLSIRFVINLLISIVDAVIKQTKGYNLVHFDLKPQNIVTSLIDMKILIEQYNLPFKGLYIEPIISNVVDYGLSLKLDVLQVRGFRGTPGYTPPEVSDKNHFMVSEKLDVYSLGVTLRKLSGFYKKNEQDLFSVTGNSFIDKDTVWDALSHYSYDDTSIWFTFKALFHLRNLLNHMTDPDANERYALYKVLSELALIREGVNANYPRLYLGLKNPSGNLAFFPTLENKARANSIFYSGKPTTPVSSLRENTANTR